MINFEILFFFQRYKSVSIISRFYFFLKHKCSSIRNSNSIFTVLFKYRKQRLIVDVFLFSKSKSVRNSKQININSWIFKVFSSTMNDDRIFFKIIMLTFNSNNFHLWIKELKDLALKIKIWEYINSYDKIEESRKEVLSKISHFVVKQSDFASSAAVDDFITNQTNQSAQDFTQFRSANYFHELSTQQQENYRTNVKEYKRKKKQIAKIIQKMLKINEAIRASIKTYIFSKLIFVLIKKILQVLIIKYKKIDDQIKKQIHEKFQALKQSSFKNQIEIWVANWENFKSRILIFDIKNFFDFETMFVEKFLIVDRKWTSTFCDNWIMQKRTTKRNVHFGKNDSRI